MGSCFSAPASAETDSLTPPSPISRDYAHRLQCALCHNAHIERMWHQQACAMFSLNNAPQDAYESGYRTTRCPPPNGCEVFVDTVWYVAPPNRPETVYFDV